MEELRRINYWEKNPIFPFNAYRYGNRVQIDGRRMGAHLAFFITSEAGRSLALVLKH